MGNWKKSNKKRKSKKKSPEYEIKRWRRLWKKIVIKRTWDKKLNGKRNDGN